MNLLCKLTLASSLLPSLAQATILPPNTLHEEDSILSLNGITQDTFTSAIEHARARYQPIFQKMGATLNLVGDWESSTVNAFASQNGQTWSVSMYGGLARRPEVTADGFALVICHEIGHHLAGFPFYSGHAMSAEGQADYYATHTCAPILWKEQTVENARYQNIAPAIVKQKCNAAWPSLTRRELCYRTAMASKSLSDLLGALNGQTTSFDTRSIEVVNQTIEHHPAAQCRLDTYVEGALCPLQSDASVIPGKSSPGGRYSVQAAMESAAYNCSNGSQVLYGPEFSNNLRPACWYKEIWTVF